MFRRLKQNVMEKAGQAQKTPLPPDVESGMACAADMRIASEKIIKAINGIIGNWKSSGLNAQEKIAEPCAVIAIKAKKGTFADSMKALNDLHNDLGRIERRNYEEIYRKIVEDTFHYFLKHESSHAVEVCNMLKKKRLDSDAANTELNSRVTPERQQRADTAKDEYESCIATAKSEFSRLPEQQRQHVRALKLMLEMLGGHYTECSQAVNNTTSLLHK